MTTLETFLPRLTSHLQKQDYLLEADPVVGGTRGLIYARSPKPYSLVLTKIVDHFLFVDWENALFARKDHMVDLYKEFNRSVNAQFKVPSALRLTIPSMALIAVSENGFDPDTAAYVEKNYQVPFKGGEVGQFFLIDLASHKITFHKDYVYRQRGSTPLYEAQGRITKLLKECLKKG
jgi:hypothetical protein